MEEQKNQHEVAGIKVLSVSSALRGELPYLGTPSLIIDVREKGVETRFEKLREIADAGVGEVVSIIGQPLRQLPALSALLNVLKGRPLIVETSGWYEPPTQMAHITPDRQQMVPIVNSCLAISPQPEYIEEGHYDWMTKFRFTNPWYKFVWQGDHTKTVKYINDFFSAIGRDMFEFIEQNRVILMPADIKDVAQCQAVWQFCYEFRLTYSCREYQRIWRDASADGRVQS